MRIAPAVLALVLALPLVSAAAPPLACADLRVVEILAGPARDWDGSGAVSTRDDEWVEILNAGAAAVDLAAYLITDGDSIPRFAPSGTLAPGGRLVVFGRDAFDWERANGHPAFGLSLANTGDAVILWRVAGAETLIVDAYAYRSHEAAADRSVGRNGDDGEWVVFDALNPYTGSTPPLGNGCAPTPAQLNSCITPAQSKTWGTLKRLYR